MKKPESHRYIRMFGPLLETLREMGGEAQAREVKRAVADKVLGGTEERERVLKSGENAAENEVAWARHTLCVAGLLDKSTKGVWRLTPTGWSTNLTLQEATELQKRVKDKSAENLDSSESEADAGPEEAPLLATMRELPAGGFERLCQRLLRELGFSDVVVTGKSGDGGIDGHGVLEVNPLVSMRVLFQCKRYQGSVGSKEVRDFRGAMSGRTEIGIILNTGSFSSEAKKEAQRDGVPTIELVDGNRLVELMEMKLIGVTPRTVYDVDDSFFLPFKNA